MSSLGEVLRILVGVLDQRGVGWFVFGAQAVAARGAPRATQDVDVTIDIPRSELPAVIEALAQQGLTHRYPDIADKLLASGAVLPLAHPSGMEIDLVIAGAGLEAIAMARATRIDIDGVSVPVAAATDLVVMKVLAGRGKDLDDVRALIAGSDVDIDEARDLLSQLEEALGQSDLLPTLQAALDDVGR